MKPAFLLLMLSASALPLAAQATGATSSSVAVAAPTASAVMRPALGSLRQALEILRPERWKAAGAVTAESTSDVGSIERDLDTTLPPLLAAADAAPGSTAQLLPAYRNVEALYDVLVRVTQTAVLAAPAQQSAALQQATVALQQSRRDFGDLLDGAAQAQDRQLHDAQARLRTLQATAAQPAPVCPPPPPVKKAKPRAKPKPPAASTAPAAQ
jgi:hypothetical protein